ncbi:hypothetical protein H0H81_012279 [Sphagnurus paluster]|uniref:FAD-binding PCMH-type domain-containing protein n=1 Tax=Sphagnurus paluster TaxID=117069 RepID=A0A9P7GNA5_9AGAR|nr:hypothetical protein H0H81_012279 [Sphagnurus paluster]
MSAFSEVTYNPTSQTAIIGAGLIWDDVYAALAPYDVNVVGGRVSGIGVAGFTLGGGYSWLSNQYGLTVDTVQAFEFVKPDGAIVTVTEASDPDLFFGLKGGMNNFGIVTRFTLRTFPQGKVWGGLITYTSPRIPAVSQATAAFSAFVTDPKASIITTYNFVLGQPGMSLLLFYDGPTPATGIFDEFLAIPSFTKDISTRDFISLVQSSPTSITSGERIGLSPFNIYFGWILELSDKEFYAGVKQSAARIRELAIAEGQGIAAAAVYPNYAIFDTPISGLYGANVPALQALKAKVDPENIMGLAGGFKII